MIQHTVNGANHAACATTDTCTNHAIGAAADSGAAAVCGIPVFAAVSAATELWAQREGLSPWSAKATGWFVGACASVITVSCTGIP
jgi:hypothetical protein